MQIFTTQNYHNSNVAYMEKKIYKIDHVLQSQLISELISEKLKRERSMIAISIMKIKSSIFR
ncbi:hypothetical protein ACWGOQ_0013400 [Aquimarina sp. M1]